MNSEPLPMEGIRVLDLGVVLAGPQAALLLADLGAEVIRVESTQHFPVMTRGPMARPSAEAIRRVPPISGGYPNREPGERPWNRFPWFNATARNKLGMTVDLKQPKGHEILKRLVRISDVLITNQTPGVMDELNIGYRTMAAENPKLVYVEASSFGASGPYRTYRALGLQMEAFAGHDLLRHYPNRDVTSNTWAVTADAAGALAIALAAQMGLYARQRTGRGQRIDLSMVENFVGLIGHVILDYTFNKRIQQSLGNRDYSAVQGCYPCAGDDRWLVLTIADDEAWSRFKTALGEPAWTSDPRLQTPGGRYAEHDLVDAHIRDWSRTLSREQAVQHLRAAGVPAGPVLDDADAYADPHLQARGYFQHVTQADAGTHRYPGPPYQSRRAPLTVRHPPVRLGEHNDYVYRELLGVTAEEFAALEAEGHIGTEYAAHIT